MILQTLFGFGKVPVIKPAAQESTRVATGTPIEGNFGKFLGAVADATINTRVGRFLLRPIQEQVNERAIRRGALGTSPVLESQGRLEGLRRVVGRLDNPILELGGKVGSVVRENVTPLDAIFGALAAGTGAVKGGTTLINRRLPQRLNPRDAVDELFGATRARPADIDEVKRVLGPKNLRSDDAFPRRGRPPVDEDELDELRGLFREFPDEVELGDILFQGPAATAKADAAAELNRIDNLVDVGQKTFPGTQNAKLEKFLDNIDLADVDDSALLDQLIARLEGRPVDIQEIMDLLRKKRN